MTRHLICSIIFLIACCWNLAAVETPIENLVRDSSFEESQEYRATYHQIGEYRLEHPSQALAITVREHFHGKQSLELAPGALWIFETTDRYAEKGVLSASIKGDSGAAAEFEVSAVTLDIHGGKLNPASTAGKFTPRAGWERVTLPFVNKRKEWSSIYTVTIRNTGTSPMWLDAVQLELEKEQASAYSPEFHSRRDIDLMRSYKLNPSSDTVNPSGQKGESGEVKLILTAPAGASASLQPVRGGIPFPPGGLFDPARVVLTDASGQPVPCQTTALARRNTDGSIFSLLLDFQAEIKPGESRNYTMKYGGEPVPAGKPLAMLKDDHIVIDTGVTTAILSKKHFRIFDEIRGNNGSAAISAADAGGFVITSDNREFTTGSYAPSVFRIENNGSQCAVIRVAGKHCDNTGKQMLDYDVRIYAFRNMPYFKIEYTVINQETPPALCVRSMGIRFPVLSGDGIRRFGLVNAPALEIPVGSGSALLTQLKQRNGESKYDVLLHFPDGVEKLMKNTRADGFASIGNASVGVADFWQLNPKGLSSEPGRLSVYLWPNEGVKVLSLPFGLASTLRMTYAPLGGVKDVFQLANFPLLLQPDPAWVSASGVFGNFITAEQARQEFPRFTSIEDRIFGLTKRFQSVSDFNGMFDYGDFGSPAYCANHETEGVDNLWLRYLRTGDPEMYRLTTATTLHSRDIDVCHIRPDVAARHTHSSGIHTCYHFHTGHFWQTGLIWHYLLTGDRRSFDVAIASAAELMAKSGINYKPGRERSRILFHLAELYGLTGVVQFRRGFERQYDFGAESNTDHAYYGGISMDCLAKMYEVTGDKKYADRLAADSATIRAKADECSDTKANIGVGEGRDWHFFKAMGEAAERTGDPAYIAAATNYFLTPYSVAMTPSDYSFSTAAPYLHALSRFGIKEPGTMPESLFGINRLSGIIPADPASNTFLFTIPGGKPFTLKIYKQLKFRFQTTFPYKLCPSVNYLLTDPSGKTIADGKLEGVQDECDMKVIEVKEASPGNYSLKLDFLNDCWGDLSCSVPARLNTNRWFFCRNSRYYPVAFWLKAPAAGQVSLEFRWPYDDNGYAGQTLGTALEDEAGRVISSKIWTVPMNWRNNNGGKYCTQKLDLTIPDDLRNKPLRLLVNDVKWMEWRIAGLDYPWFASVKEGIKP